MTRHNETLRVDTREAPSTVHRVRGREGATPVDIKHHNGTLSARGTTSALPPTVHRVRGRGGAAPFGIATLHRTSRVRPARRDASRHQAS